MKKYWGAAVLAAGVLLVAGCGMQRDVEVEPGTSPISAVPIPPPAGPGDAAPHEAENRGSLQPHDLSAADERLLTTAAAKVRPALEKLRAAKDFRVASIVAVFTAAGYPATTIQAEPMTGGSGVVFGVSTGHGCLVGDVRPERADVQPRGIIAEWGCTTPVTH